MKTLVKVLLVVCFLVGVVSVFIFTVYLASMIVYVTSDATDMGAIAYTPKWIFALSFLVLLWKTRTVKEAAERIESLHESYVQERRRREERRQAQLRWWELTKDE